MPTSAYENMVGQLSRSRSQAGWSAGNEATLLEPYTYITAAGGKQFRSHLISAFNAWLHIPPHRLEIIARVVGMLHNASLLMDDVEDNSQLRRGVPVAHKIYGVPQTVNSANYVYFLAYQEIFALGESIRADPPRRSAASSSRSASERGEPVVSPSMSVAGEAPTSPVPSHVASVEGFEGRERLVDDGSSTRPSELASASLLSVSDKLVVDSEEAQSQSTPPPSIATDDLAQLVTEELLNLHRGQGLDIFWRDSLTCPTEEEYVDMVNGKTGGLLRIAIKLMMASSDSDVDYVPLVNLIGVYFQIRDDYMNLQSTQYSDNKGYAEDLTEGKFSFPIVHAVRADTSNRQVLNVLQKRPTTPTTKRYIVSYMRDSTRSFEYTLQVMQSLEKQAFEEIKRLGGNEGLEAILKGLTVMEEVEGSNV